MGKHKFIPDLSTGVIHNNFIGVHSSIINQFLQLFHYIRRNNRGLRSSYIGTIVMVGESGVNGITPTEMGKATGTAMQTARAKLRLLVREGWLSKTKAVRGYRYILSERGQSVYSQVLDCWDDYMTNLGIYLAGYVTRRKAKRKPKKQKGVTAADIVCEAVNH